MHMPEVLIYKEVTNKLIHIFLMVDILIIVKIGI